jgi:hypothetical protein
MIEDTTDHVLRFEVPHMVESEHYHPRRRLLEPVHKQLLITTYVTSLCRGQVLMVQRRGIREADARRAQPYLHPPPHGN